MQPALDKLETFKEACKPLVEWMQKNCTPHDKAIVDIGSAELVSGEMCTHFEVND